jgi:hypothetical protein
MRVAVILLIVLAVIGCGPKNKLVGTWTGQAGSMTSEVTYGADGSLKGTAQPTMGPMQGTTVTVEGKYRLEGDMLYVTVAKSDIQNLPANLQAMKDQVMSGLNAGLKIGQEQKSKIEWKDDHTYVSKEGDTGQAVTFTRKK